MSAERRIRVGLLWHSPNSGNLGVGALTIANLGLAREAAAGLGLTPDFTIIGMRDDGPTYVTPDQARAVTVDTRVLLSPSGCWRVIGEQDCVLDIGGGDSFAEIYGLKRFMFLWLTKMMAVMRGVPLLLSPQTIGPFTRAPYQALARLALTRAKAVLARDEVSLQALRTLAPKAAGSLAVDVAFALPYESQAALRGGDRVRVGINVSGLLFNEARSGSNRFGLQVDYAELMERLVGDLSADPGIQVHLISHVAGRAEGADDDGPVAEALAKAFPGALLAPRFEGPSQAKSYISGLDFLVSGRMHACIAAFSSGVPVVPVAYSRKFSGLFGMLGYAWLVPVKGLETDGALAYLHDCLKRRDLLAQDVARGMSKVGALLDVYRSALSSFLSNAAARA
ncbi:MAG TPA: polysaccharide pyruvyl transferase family protein [Caulobacteraceae bacterium]|nr:polysaccharide pyruvyl transferase family protein [Caulobacteraceae bacterium]